MSGALPLTCEAAQVTKRRLVKRGLSLLDLTSAHLGGALFVMERVGYITI